MEVHINEHKLSYQVIEERREEVREERTGQTRIFRQFKVDFFHDRQAIITIEAKTTEVAHEVLETIGRRMRNKSREEFDQFVSEHIAKGTQFTVDIKGEISGDQVIIYKPHRLAYKFERAFGPEPLSIDMATRLRIKKYIDEGLDNKKEKAPKTEDGKHRHKVKKEPLPNNLRVKVKKK